MPATDILNPTTVLTNNAAVSSANALAVKVISSASATGITVDSTTITGGTTARLLYDNGATVGETAAVTYASASITLALSSLAIFGFLSSASVVDTALARSAAGSLAVRGSGAAIAGTILASNAVLSGTLGYGGITFASTATGTGSLVGAAAPTLTGQTTFSTGGSNPILLTNVGNATSYAAVVFSSSTLAQDIIGMFAGQTGDSNLYLRAPTGGGIEADINNVKILGVTSVTTTIVGTLTYGGVAAASTVTGTGSLVLGTNPTISSLIATGTLTYGGVTLSSAAPTGTGVMVLATNPTLSSLVATGTSSFSVANFAGLATFASAITVTGAASLSITTHAGLATFSSAVTINTGGALTYGGVTLASTVTGTGSMVLAASPALTGTASIAAATFSGLATFSSAQTTVGTGTFANGVAASASVATTALLWSSTASFGIQWGAFGSVVPTIAATQGSIFSNTTGSSTAGRLFVRGSAAWIAVTTAS